MPRRHGFVTHLQVLYAFYMKMIDYICTNDFPVHHAFKDKMIDALKSHAHLSRQYISVTHLRTRVCLHSLKNLTIKSNRN